MTGATETSSHPCFPNRFIACPNDEISPPDYLEDALADIEAEEAGLHEQVREIEQREHLNVERASLGQQLHDLAERAEAKLDSLTEPETAELFDLLQLDVERIGAHKFEGTASIPIPPDGGEVWTEEPQPLYPILNGSEFPLEVTV